MDRAEFESKGYQFYAGTLGDGWGIWRWDGEDEMILIAPAANERVASALALLLRG